MCHQSESHIKKVNQITLNIWSNFPWRAVVKETNAGETYRILGQMVEYA